MQMQIRIQKTIRFGYLGRRTGKYKQKNALQIITIIIMKRLKIIISFFFAIHRLLQRPANFQWG